MFIKLFDKVTRVIELYKDFCYLHKHYVQVQEGSHGVMVSTLDFESSDPSLNLGGTFI